MSNLTMRRRYQEAKQTGRTLIGGHRGNPADHPENTLRSFGSALDLGVDLIECDVHLSADGDLIVIHDHTLDRTTNGSGLVRETTSSDLRSLDAGMGEKLPFLAEVLEQVCPRAGLVIELKQAPLPHPDLERRLVELLRSAALIDQVAVISFHHPSIKALKEIEPSLQTGVLEVGRPVDPVAIMRRAGADIYSPHYSGADPELVDLVHEAGGFVALWTVDDATGVTWSRHCRPDAVFSNRPAEIAAAFRTV